MNVLEFIEIIDKVYETNGVSRRKEFIKSFIKEMNSRGVEFKASMTVEGYRSKVIPINKKAKDLVAAYEMIRRIEKK